MDSVLMSRGMTIFVLLFLRLALRYGTKKEDIVTGFYRPGHGLCQGYRACRRMFLLSLHLNFLDGFVEKKKLSAPSSVFLHKIFKSTANRACDYSQLCYPISNIST